MEAMAPGNRYYLKSGEYLKAGEYLRSLNGQYYAVMQGDGRFAVCSGTGPQDPLAKVKYQYPADPRQVGQYFAIMQHDGNFVIYKSDTPPDHGAYVWGIQGFVPQLPLLDGPGYQINLTDDGNLRVYDWNSRDRELGSYWSAFETEEPEVDDTATTVAAIQFMALYKPPQDRYKVRRQFQPLTTGALTSISASLSNNHIVGTSWCKLSVYRGGLDSTDLVTSAELRVPYVSDDDMTNKEVRQMFTFFTPPMVRSMRLYTMEVETDNKALRLGLNSPTSEGGPYDDLLALATYVRKQDW